jgi:hypothetical protein
MRESMSLRPPTRQMDVLESRTTNRRTVQTSLELFVTTLALPPALSDAIATAPIGPAFLAAVTELHAKMQFMQRLPPQTPALGDVTIDFNALRSKVRVCVCVCVCVCVSFFVHFFSTPAHPHMRRQPASFAMR